MYLWLNHYYGLQFKAHYLLKPVNTFYESYTCR